MLNDDYNQINLLVEKAKLNDEKALWDLFDFYTPIVNSTITKVHNKFKFVEKDDLFTECALIFKDLCEKYDKDKSYFTYYIETRMQPYLISKVKSKYIQKISTVSFEDYHELEYYEEPFKLEDHSELIEQIDKMPKDMKHVIDLFYFKNLNQNECATIMNISQPAFNKKLKRAIDYLKRNLSKEL